MQKLQRCVHRHTIDEHPSCFKQGRVKEKDNKKTKEPWYSGKRVAYLDIETSNLYADFGVILSWCLKFRGDDDIQYGLITKEELFDLEFDRRVVKELVNALKDVDILVTYFGKPFDLKYIRSRALYWGIDFPAYGTLFHWDLYYHVKRDFRISSNRLKTITHFLGIDGKTDIDWEVWNKARYGDKKALKEVLAHNKGDVIILEELHDRIGEFSKWIKSSL